MAAALLDSGAGSRAPSIRSCIILCTVTCKYFISTILSIITQCTGAARDRRTQHDEDQASRVKLANGKHGNTQDDTMILSRSLLAFLVFHSSPPSSWSWQRLLYFSSRSFYGVHRNVIRAERPKVQSWSMVGFVGYIYCTHMALLLLDGFTLAENRLSVRGFSPSHF